TMYHTYFNQSNNLVAFARVTSVASASDNGWTVLGCIGTTPANGITCADAVLFYAPLALGPGTPNTVYYGTDRLYRSSNSGTNNSVVSQAPLAASVPISAIAVSPQDDNYRIVGLTNGSLFYTTTGSSTLGVLDPTGGTGVIPDKYVARAAFDPSDKNTAYIAIGGYMGGTSAAQSHVWKVTNLGTTPVIAAVNSGLPDVPVNAFVVDPASSSNLFAGTDIGVFNSTDGGATWNVYGTGLPVVAVFDMAIQKATRTLRVATHGRGMWENNGPPLPIQLASFTGTAAAGQGVLLRWSTASETNSYGFEVQKAIAPAGPFASIPGSFVRGHGTTATAENYSFTDAAPGTGTVYYRLKQLDLDGTFRYSDGIEVAIASGIAGPEFPTEFSLAQSYPNPFNPTATIRYGIPVKAHVTLEVFTALGQRVATLVNEDEEAGYHDVKFNATGLASGAYFYAITAGDYRATKKLALVR
ncbi:MAG TPA: T9SS type A sorting domain-containing protein, partial [Bacteroidota bacterium]|nr:T9SS type A sorting domain-containing protein [Bacteroidota bacterium]